MVALRDSEASGGNESSVKIIPALRTQGLIYTSSIPFITENTYRTWAFQSWNVVGEILSLKQMWWLTVNQEGYRGGIAEVCLRIKASYAQTRWTWIDRSCCRTLCTKRAHSKWGWWFTEAPLALCHAVQALSPWIWLSVPLITSCHIGYVFATVCDWCSTHVGQEGDFQHGLLPDLRSIGLFLPGALLTYEYVPTRSHKKLEEKAVFPPDWLRPSLVRRWQRSFEVAIVLSVSKSDEVFLMRAAKTIAWSWNRMSALAGRASRQHVSYYCPLLSLPPLPNYKFKRNSLTTAHLAVRYTRTIQCIFSLLNSFPTTHLTYSSSPCFVDLTAGDQGIVEYTMSVCHFRYIYIYRKPVPCLALRAWRVIWGARQTACAWCRKINPDGSLWDIAFFKLIGGLSRLFIGSLWALIASLWLPLILFSTGCVQESNLECVRTFIYLRDSSSMILYGSA